ncbi:MAG TPA: transcription-repair coupling factor [Verrucomicrobiae bacterium]|nr:transcription-repair coupling factor [Verrucomicrobiae bacterium]
MRLRRFARLTPTSADPAAGDLFARFTGTPAAQSLARRLETGKLLSVFGVNAAAQPFLAATIHRLFPNRPIVLVADNLKTQESFQQDLETWTRSPLGGGDSPASILHPLLFFPDWEMLPHEARLPHPDVISDRLDTLIQLMQVSDDASRPAPILVTSVIALLQRTFERAALERATRWLKRGDHIEPLDLIEWLEDHGYEPEAQVTQKGEIALRGGILDVFPLTSPWPVRLEFFGDELESLRYFDPQTQISREEIPGVSIPPAGELGLLRKGETANRRIGESASAENSATAASLLDYLPPETLFILCEPDVLEERALEYERQVNAGDPFFISWNDFRAEAERRGCAQIEVHDAPREEFGEINSEDAMDLSIASLDSYRPLAERAPEIQIAEAQRREFFQQLHRWLRQDFAVHIFCNNDGEQQRFQEIWQDHIKAGSVAPTENGNRSELSPQFHLGSLARGFICEPAKLVAVTDAEIFGRYKVQRARRLKSPHAQASRSALDIDFTELEEGDLVVHVQHGVGRFLGLKILPTGAGTKPTDKANPVSNTECLVLEYAASDPAQPPPKLYVPVTEAHLVSKYVGAGKFHPPLNTLGGTRWNKAKEQAERAVRDVAAELLSIQAARESQEGHAFKPDAAWQREFEGAFIYEETPDQLRAINETKADMERPKPMDRLICGDVGFGKTEVAIRAAFKAVMDGRQVAVLVPTTVLAQQHYNTFRERMADYPVRVELLSRFRTRREQQKAIKDLAAGAVDIVVGTHRLIQSDIVFKDLGLVIIDEEQRFGVLHKEKFKMLRKLVDVLTLSATPIPRTLYLALTGARDMSAIQTPPHDRLPVETIVTQYDERIIRDAIQRELNRGGQVFFLHNRVMTIHTMEQKLHALVSQARIVVGHGQMDADDLEEVMTKFINGEADILLSTTIIESGLDIPNANTIIIDRADRFGLSDLYQLRGRVGRYKHQAYAYLLLPRHAGLLNDVRKRISAIKQYSTLGSGFKIAMRDLEIRGAGNLLGAEQSGHITAVGFDLYCQLLKQSVSALKGEKVKPRVEVSVRLDFLETNPVSDAPHENARTQKFAGLPHAYIPESQHRIDIYRKLAQATDKVALESLTREMRDRFGPIPPSVELLLQIAELKSLAAERDVTVIEVKEDKLMLTRRGDFIMLGGKFPRLSKKDAKARLKEIKKLLLAI